MLASTRSVFVCTCLALALVVGALGGARAVHALTPTEASNEQFAGQDATASFSLLQLPPGTAWTEDNPAAPSSLLDNPGTGTPATPRLVDQHQFARTPGRPQDVIEWFKAHPPAETRIVGGSSGGKIGAPPVWSVSFTRRTIRNALSMRELVVTAAPADDGSTALRVDALVIWITPRAASDLVPAGARELTVVLRGPQHALVSRLDVREPQRIAVVARILNRMPLVQPGMLLLCGREPGIHAQLTFRSSGSGPPLARARTGTCGDVRLAIHGRAVPTLFGFSLLADLEAALGVDINPERLLSGQPKIAPQPVMPVATGTLPGGGRFTAVAYRDPRLGVCLELFHIRTRGAFGCLPHPHGKHSAAAAGLSCYPRAVSSFAVLGGRTAVSAVAVFDDGVRVAARRYGLVAGSHSTPIGLRSDEPVRLSRPAPIRLDYDGPFFLGFRRGVHDLLRVEVLDARGSIVDRLNLDGGPFAQC